MSGYLLEPGRVRRRAARRRRARRGGAGRTPPPPPASRSSTAHRRGAPHGLANTVVHVGSDGSRDRLREDAHGREGAAGVRARLVVRHRRRRSRPRLLLRPRVPRADAHAGAAGRAGAAGADGVGGGAQLRAGEGRRGARGRERRLPGVREPVRRRSGRSTSAARAACIDPLGEAVRLLGNDEELAFAEVDLGPRRPAARPLRRAHLSAARRPPARPLRRRLSPSRRPRSRPSSCRRACPVAVRA